MLIKYTTIGQNNYKTETLIARLEGEYNLTGNKILI